MIPLSLASKEEVAYKVATDLDESCSNCGSFTAPKSCSQVEGPVDPSFTCDKFQSADDASVVAEPTEPEAA